MNLIASWTWSKTGEMVIRPCSVQKKTAPLRDIVRVERGRMETEVYIEEPVFVDETGENTKVNRSGLKKKSTPFPDVFQT